MGISSVAAIALSAMQAQSNDLSETADNIANPEDITYTAEHDESSAASSVDLASDLADLSEDELSYRASAAAFETGADLWALLNAVSRD